MPAKGKQVFSYMKPTMLLKACLIPIYAMKQRAQIRHEPSYKQLGVNRTEHRFYAEIATDITTRN